MSRFISSLRHGAFENIYLVHMNNTKPLSRPFPCVSLDIHFMNALVMSN